MLNCKTGIGEDQDREKVPHPSFELHWPNLCKSQKLFHPEQCTYHQVQHRQIDSLVSLEMEKRMEMTGPLGCHGAPLRSWIGTFSLRGEPQRQHFRTWSKWDQEV